MSPGPPPAGAVLSAMAGQLHDLKRCVENAISSGDLQALPAILAAVNVAGLMADQTAQALGEIPSDDVAGWLFTPRVEEALGELRATK